MIACMGMKEVKYENSRIGCMGMETEDMGKSWKSPGWNGLTVRMILYLKFGDFWLHFSQVYWPSCSVTFLLQSAFGHAFNKTAFITPLPTLQQAAWGYRTYFIEAVVFLAESDGTLTVEIVGLVSVAQIQLPHLVYSQEPQHTTCYYSQSHTV